MPKRNRKLPKIWNGLKLSFLAADAGFVESPSKPESYLELLAEMDALAAYPIALESTIPATRVNLHRFP